MIYRLIWHLPSAPSGSMNEVKSLLEDFLSKPVHSFVCVSDLSINEEKNTLSKQFSNMGIYAQK